MVRMGVLWGLLWSVNRWDPILQGMEHFHGRKFGETAKRGDVRRAGRASSGGGEGILREADGVWCSGRGKGKGMLVKLADWLLAHTPRVW